MPLPRTVTLSAESRLSASKKRIWFWSDLTIVNNTRGEMLVCRTVERTCQSCDKDELYDAATGTELAYLMDSAPGEAVH